jgi:hypothetical protein
MTQGRLPSNSSGRPDFSKITRLTSFTFARCAPGPGTTWTAGCGTCSVSCYTFLHPPQLPLSIAQKPRRLLPIVRQRLTFYAIIIIEINYETIYLTSPHRAGASRFDSYGIESSSFDLRKPDALWRLLLPAPSLLSPSLLSSLLPSPLLALPRLTPGGSPIFSPQIVHRPARNLAGLFCVLITGFQRR